jgi:hypothetical protein
MGGIAWHQYFGGQKKQWKIGVKNLDPSRYVNNNNIFHKTATKFTKCPLNISNGCKICRPIGHKIYQQFPLQDPPKFTQIGIFGLKTNHPATQVDATSQAAAKSKPKWLSRNAKRSNWRWP